MQIDTKNNIWLVQGQNVRDISPVDTKKLSLKMNRICRTSEFWAWSYG